jgi:N-methylhydantoinase A
LKLDTFAAAEAIVRVANSRMAGALRLVSIERGHEPKRFALMPFGGAGALHAGALMKETGLGSTLVPRYPGVTSALGCVIADMRHDFTRTVNKPLDALDARDLGQAIAEAATAGTALIAASGVKLDGIETSVELDMSYIGQTHTLAVPLASIEPDREAIQAAFERAYKAAFGRLLDGIAARVLTLKVAIVGKRPKLDLALLAPKGGAIEPAGRRQVRFDGAFHDTAIYRRLALPVDAIVAGPAILEQPDATTVIEPDLAARVDRFGNLIVTRK